MWKIMVADHKNQAPHRNEVSQNALLENCICFIFRQMTFLRQKLAENRWAVCQWEAAVVVTVAVIVVVASAEAEASVEVCQWAAASVVLADSNFRQNNIRTRHNNRLT